MLLIYIGDQGPHITLDPACLSLSSKNLQGLIMRSSHILALAWALSCSAATLPACGVSRPCLHTYQGFDTDSIPDKLCCPSDQEDRMRTERQPMHLQLRALCRLSAILLLQEVQCR